MRTTATSSAICPGPSGSRHPVSVDGEGRSPQPTRPAGRAAATRCPRAPRAGSSPALATATRSFLWLQHEPNNWQQKGRSGPRHGPSGPERTERVSTRGSGRAGAEERPSDSGRWQAERRPGPPPRDPGHMASRLPGRSERNSLEHRGQLPSQLGSHKGNWTGRSNPLGFQATEGTFPCAPGKCSGWKCVGVSLLDS